MTGKSTNTERDELLMWVGEKLENVATDLQNDDIEAAGEEVGKVGRGIQRSVSSSTDQKIQDD